MAYTTVNKSTDYFNTKLYTGNGSTNAITGVGFQPDMCWWKMRSGTEEHALGDAVRGAGYIVKPNSTDGEAQSASYFASFDSDGFTLGSDTKTNGNGSTYASWNWKANGQGSSNTDGSINTTYTSANTTSGFSICQYTGTGANATVGHGLGVTPKMIIVKRTNTTGDWTIYHKSLGATKYIFLQSTDASGTQTSIWNDTEPTTTVFTVGTSSTVNQAGSTYVAYCFAEKKGFSKFGSYTGNGNADGAFIYTGFKPAFVMAKYASGGGTGSWHMYDNKRKGYNTENDYVQANTTSSENSDTDQVDLLSNGFKWRANGSETNTNGGTMIYMAFAEAPLVGSNNVPATAR